LSGIEKYGKIRGSVDRPWLSFLYIAKEDHTYKQNVANINAIDMMEMIR
jgi:hypothetical protein